MDERLRNLGKNEKWDTDEDLALVAKEAQGKQEVWMGDHVAFLASTVLEQRRHLKQCGEAIKKLMAKAVEESPFGCEHGVEAPTECPCAQSCRCRRSAGPCASSVAGCLEHEKRVEMLQAQLAALADKVQSLEKELTHVYEEKLKFQGQVDDFEERFRANVAYAKSEGLGDIVLFKDAIDLLVYRGKVIVQIREEQKELETSVAEKDAIIQEAQKHILSLQVSLKDAKEQARELKTELSTRPTQAEWKELQDKLRAKSTELAEAKEEVDVLRDRLSRFEAGRQEDQADAAQARATIQLMMAAAHINRRVYRALSEVVCVADRLAKR